MFLSYGESENIQAYAQYATVPCHGCGEPVVRTMKTIIKMLEVDNFVACSNTCREAVDQEWFEVLMLTGGAIH
jgi:hypothetical protein